MGILKRLKIVSGNKNVGAEIFENLFGSNFFSIEYNAPSDYVNMYWERYISKRPSYNLNDQAERSINGSIFEYILCTLLIREEILPIFKSAQVAFVPNINFDIILYSTKKGPICLSAKTSFRERYKQADLEAMALKYVHRKSKSYLLTMAEDDSISINEKIESGDVIGLDKAIFAGGAGFDELVANLSKLEFASSPKVEIITSNQIIERDTVNGEREN